MSKKLTFSENLYIGESINIQKLDKLKKTLVNSPVLAKVFLITISTNPGEQLDIIEAKYLTYAYYNIHSLHVVGLAKSNGEAVGLVQRIVQECLDEQKNVDLKWFLMKNEGKTGDI